MYCNKLIKLLPLHNYYENICIFRRFLHLKLCRTASISIYLATFPCTFGYFPLSVVYRTAIITLTFGYFPCIIGYSPCSQLRIFSSSLNGGMQLPDLRAWTIFYFYFILSYIRLCILFIYYPRSSQCANKRSFCKLYLSTL